VEIGQNLAVDHWNTPQARGVQWMHCRDEIRHLQAMATAMEAWMELGLGRGK
jgi:hypothetical protein